MKARIIATGVFVVTFVCIFMLAGIVFVSVVRGGIHSDWWYPWAGIIALFVAVGYSFRIYKVVK